ncbi:MAG TPA: PIG-L deacetylase family protein [Candidatus Limnocylindria bacterium]|nr:PIG-L deacetylase family protein [Candidatus Limnocylindria bacterium]
MSSIWRPIRERQPPRSLMVIVAHPGDEAFGFGGAIAQAVASGAYVVVVCATRGRFDARLLEKAPAPGGRNRHYTRPVVWRNLDTVREDELRRSVTVLGVRVLRMLDYAEEDLANADFDELVSRLVEPIRMHRPQVILSFGPDGVSGDADHVVVGRAALAAFDLAGEPLAFEDDLEEDQVAWRAAKLYQLVVPASQLEPLGDRAPAEYGSGDDAGTLAIELGELAQLKLAAISRHVSQTGSDGAFRDWTPEARAAFLAREHYRLVRSNLPVPAGGGEPASESGFWDGLG